MITNLPKSIELECSNYIKDYIPIYKLLPPGEIFRKIKVRNKSNHLFDIEQRIDEAFSCKYKNLSLRSVIGATDRNSIIPDPELRLFNIYPVNGYKILYNPIGASYVDIIEPLDSVSDNIDSSNELFHLTFIEGSLSDAKQVSSDVIIYGIKYFYAIESTLVDEMNNETTVNK